MDSSCRFGPVDMSSCTGLGRKKGTWLQTGWWARNRVNQLLYHMSMGNVEFNLQELQEVRTGFRSCTGVKERRWQWPKIKGWQFENYQPRLISLFFNSFFTFFSPSYSVQMGWFRILDKICVVYSEIPFHFNSIYRMYIRLVRFLPVATAFERPHCLREDDLPRGAKLSSLGVFFDVRSLYSSWSSYAFLSRSTVSLSEDVL